MVGGGQNGGESGGFRSFGNCSVDLQTEGGLCLSFRCSLCSDSCVLACVHKIQDRSTSAFSLHKRD